MWKSLHEAKMIGKFMKLRHIFQIKLICFDQLNQPSNISSENVGIGCLINRVALADKELI